MTFGEFCASKQPLCLQSLSCVSSLQLVRGFCFEDTAGLLLTYIAATLSRTRVGLTLSSRASLISRLMQLTLCL